MACDRSKIPGWVADYIGIPWAVHGRGPFGCDCWGLVRLVLFERFGVMVPSYRAGYEGAGAADVADIAALIAGALSPDWRARPAAAAGDVLLIRLWGRPSHVGIVVAPGWMLHVEEGIDSVCVEFDGPVWRDRIVGVYRHALLG